MITGCDGDEDDEETDSEIMIGTWSLSTISDDEGDKTDVFFAEANSVVVVLNNDDSFTIAMDFNAAAEAAGATDVNLAGTYSVNESAKTLTLTIAGIGASLQGQYTVVNNDRIRISAPAALTNALFGGTPNVGTVVITLDRQ
jgi:hypothetical protein